MPDTRKQRAHFKPAGPKCPRCLKQPANLQRHDQLCANCSYYPDAQAKEIAAQQQNKK